MTMDPRHQYILRKLQLIIVKDLEVKSVIDGLMSGGIVSSALWEEIQRETSSESESRKLLDILPKRGPEAYSVFKNAIKADYWWIVEAMENLEAEDSVDSIDPQLGPHNLYSHLPANPPLSVEREQKMNKLRTGLTELQPGNYLVLHALQGYGKSTLASTTLRDARFVERFFKNEIYWVKFGQHQSVSENKLMQLNVLFHLVRDLDPLTEPTSEDSLKYSLKRHFSSHNYALIILDDVNSQEVIEAFDFGCKTLVLTTDVEILRGKSSNVIEMCDGFSANESLNLFSKATGIPVSELPKQARQIHEECKGMPLMISMFSAQFEGIKESLVEGKTSDEIWSYYLNALREKSSNVIQESLERRAATFDLCIEKLSPEDKRYYKTLAIFPEDVNIPTKTLSIFWDVELAEVNSRMLRFRQKSLACRKWHPSCQTYVYGVHNLLLSHLRDKLTPEELKSLHRSYVNKNLAICKRDFSKLPTDNYIHSYIGYHMKKGELLDEFSKIYLNFGFIEAKVFNIGTGDLLIDLKKYRNYITRDSPELLEEVEDLEKFLVQQAPTLAEYRRRNCLDLVQVALKHPFQGFVRRTAECLANERHSRLYLNHLKHNTEYPNSYSEELHLQVRSVAFTNEAEVILVGNDEGKVISWNCNNRQHVTFGGNNAEQPITKIVAPEKEKFFISISGDGRAKLFDLQGEWNRQTDDHIKTLPPIAKQPEWINMSESKSSQDDSRITFDVPEQKIIDIAVSTEGRKIAACTDSGAVVAWDFNGNNIFSYQLASRAPSISIAFTMSSTMIITVDGSSKALLILDASNGQYKSQMSLNPENDKIISLLSVPKYCNILIVLLETKICSLRWAMNGDPYQGPHIKKFAELGENGTYTSAAVTRDGRYIVTADTGGSVNICDLHEGLKVVRTYKNLIFSLDTHWLEDEACHIICGGNRDSLVPMVHRWKFDPQAKPVVRRLPLFDATMEPCERNVIAIGTSNGTVQIIQNDDVIAETPAVDGKITSLLIYNDGNQVVYGTDKGSVFIFDIKHKHPKEIMELYGPIDFLKTLKIRGKDVIVCKKLGERDVQIWKSPDYTEMVENTGSVIYCDTITSVERVLTVSDRVIKILDQNTWKTHSKYEPKSVHKINCCSLSSKQNYLALANGTGNFNVSKLITRPDLRSIKFQEFIVRKLDDGITACDFSQDEELLALGLKTGEIIIINVLTSSSEVRKLQFHRRPVKGLYWCPAEIENRVLLSLTDELAWWNVTMESHNEQQREISHSLSELTLRPESKGAVSKIGRMTTSKSLELGSFKQMDKSEFDNNSDVFFDANHGVDLAQSLNGFNGANQRPNPSLWSKKKPKFNKIDGLLSVVKLDDDLAGKVCISDRFSHFVTLNGEESIYNLTIFEPRNKETVNGDT